MKYLILLCVLSATLLASNTVKLGSLEWQDNSQAKSNKLGWSEAKAYCQELSLAGYDDWRLPNIKELQSIVDVKRYTPAINRGFKNVASKVYWSSSQDASDAKNAWYVYFNRGNTDYYSKSNEYFVRCVRSRQ